MVDQAVKANKGEPFWPVALAMAVMIAGFAGITIGPTLYAERREARESEAAVPAPSGLIQGRLRVTGMIIGAEGTAGATAVVTGGERPYRVELKGALARAVLTEAGTGPFGSQKALDAIVAIGAPGEATAVQVGR